MKKKNRSVFILMLCFFAFLIGTGCSSTKLAEDFEEDAVKEKAEEVVMLMGNEDYESVCGMLREDLKEKLLPEQLEESTDAYFADRGAFDKIKNMAVVGQKAEDTEEDVAVAVAVAAYENQNITYTISFDTNMEIIGLYQK